MWRRVPTSVVTIVSLHPSPSFQFLQCASWQRAVPGKVLRAGLGSLTLTSLWAQEGKFTADFKAPSYQPGSGNIDGHAPLSPLREQPPHERVPIDPTREPIDAYDGDPLIVHDAATPIRRRPYTRPRVPPTKMDRKRIRKNSFLNEINLSATKGNGSGLF